MEERTIAYTIKDPLFVEFSVYTSANAWWMDKPKVDKLIEAFKGGHTVKVACTYTGITRDQYLYFIQVHPDFKRVKGNCMDLPLLRAMDTVQSHLSNLVTARWYVGRRHPSFNPKLPPEEDEFADIQTTPQVPYISEEKLVEILERIAREVFFADELTLKVFVYN